MHAVGVVVTCVGLALSAAGCDPTLGAEVELYTADPAPRIALLNPYVSLVCAQASSNVSCDGNWSMFVQAGMNDIDRRCDGFLAWLNARARDKKPIIAESSTINTAGRAIMTVSGSNPTPLNMVAAAFGLASASHANRNSQLLISVNRSTVQEIVLTGRAQFRDKIKNYVVPDQPAAIHLLRNYVQLCMPITIEASINKLRAPRRSRPR
jgi:hypothetical protein